MNPLMSLLVHEIQDLYSAETQFFDALPQLAETARDADLKAALQLHYIETILQLERLERVAEILEVPAATGVNQGMRGLLAEAGETLDARRPEIADSSLIGAAQKVEHYEIAGYGTARAHAQRLGLVEVARMLQQTLEEKTAASDKLALIAESRVDYLAAAGRAPVVHYQAESAA